MGSIMLTTNCPDEHTIAAGSSGVDSFAPLSAENAPAVPSEPDAKPAVESSGRIYRAVKNPLERFAAVMMIILFSPLLILLTLLVKLTSRGPALYCQTRMGLHGKTFTIYKFRSMTHECEKATGAVWCKPEDPRITPLGAFLRKSHLDELPQLWNVLRGDMSLIGPRPERPEIVVTLVRDIPNYRDRLLVLPGVTGLAQVWLPPDTSLDSVRLKLRYDVVYIQNESWSIDLRILIATAFGCMGLSYPSVSAFLRLPRPDRPLDPHGDRPNGTT